MLREEDKEKDMAARKAAQVTYLSAYQSFCRRAVITIYDYFKDSFIAICNNTYYIISVVIPVLGSVALSGLINHDIRKSASTSTSDTASTSTSAVLDNDATRDLHTKVSYGREEKLEPIRIVRKSGKYSPGDYEKTIISGVISKIHEIRLIYAQPAKISLACTLTSFFIFLNQLGNPLPNSLWAVLVVILVRQENTSSSFLTGYQRLEGTVVGAVYAYSMFQIFNCAKEECGMNISTPVLVIWLAFCAFFRDGPRHGYAALVAGFTPIVLFLGNTPSTAKGAWERVALTFIGIGIYLLVDNLILPNRTDVALRAGVLQSIQETRYVHAVLTAHFLYSIELLNAVGLCFSWHYKLLILYSFIYFFIYLFNCLFIIENSRI